VNIGRKISLYVIATFVVIALSASYLYYTMEVNEEADRFDSLGHEIGTTVEMTLGNAMLRRDLGILNEALDNLKNLAPISTVSLVNRSGVIKASSDQRRVGTEFSPAMGKYFEMGGKGVLLKDSALFRFFQPVTNKTQCYGCHKPEDRYNGLIVVDFTLQVLQKQVQKDIFRGFTIFIPALLIVGFGIVFMSRTLISKRLKSVINKVEEVTGGHYTGIIPMEGNDEITELEGTLNKMTDAVNARDTELKNIYFSVLSSLVQAMEQKDGTTAGHCKRVGYHAELIADALDLGERERRDLNAVAMLHDIGKIGISDFILGKKASLDDEEFTLIRSHPQRGVAILSPLKQFESILPAILSHHENFDGSGYPNGLSGEDIPLLARIIAVSDTYDAIVSTRPYRPAASHETAIAELKKFAGTQFDPAIVEAFVEAHAAQNNSAS